MLLLALICGDVSVPVFMGWSADGTKVCLVQIGVHDGSGFPFAWIEVLGPTGTDRYFYEYNCYEEEMNDSALVFRAREVASRLGVVGDNKGVQLSVRPADSLELSEEGVTVRNYGCGAGSASVEERHTGMDENELWPVGGVVVYWNRKQVFSSDVGEEGFSWWLQDAYIRQGKLALVLGRHEPGFEGPNSRFTLVVTDISQ